ncbi:hypothetical protein WJX81_004122 [Elliptochloris bilobata]|uniref:Beta-galactosidase galactose-binding domain-containing protein n=1 Tax=Elliptochloris bilobata TaxID=381761 RepID=A0AAW1SDJ5_9CHLO
MGGEKLLDSIFNLKFTSKQLVKSSIKCEKDEKAEKLKVKKAIEKGNIDGAKIYAQNAIRKKTEALNYLRLASRLDAVVSRLDTQAKMNAINSSMSSIVKQLDRALAGNNLERVADTMDQFEKQFENLDVQSQFVEGAMNAQASMATPEADVNLLLQQVADEHGLEVQLGLPQAGSVLTDWRVFPLQLDNPAAVRFRPAAALGAPSAAESGPVGTLHINGSAEGRNAEGTLPDTYIDVRGWGKGLLWVNGFNLGWFWPSAGPQEAQYVPGPLLQDGENEVILLETEVLPTNPSVVSTPQPNFFGPYSARGIAHPPPPTFDRSQYLPAHAREAYERKRMQATTAYVA